MKKMALSVALSLMAGIAGGAAAMWLAQPTAVFAQANAAPALPPLFAVGATVTSTIGEVQIQEIYGEWIRVKSLNSVDNPIGDNWWIYVPSQAGAWHPGKAYATLVPK